MRYLELDRRNRGGIIAPQSDFYNKSVVINESALSVPSVMWFKPYLASDYPEITCDKKYFFIYSTDHSTGSGEIWWGKGDKLDGSDFIEQGIIISGYQSETPTLLRIPECGDSEVIHLFYHTADTDPSNNGKQQTHLITTSGGVLNSATWTQRGLVLGGSESHTGYYDLYKKKDGTYKGVHLQSGGTPQTYIFSSTTNGRTFTRNELFDRLIFLQDANRQFKAVSGGIFKRLDIFWAIMNVVPTDFNGNSYFCLVRLDDNFQPIQFCGYLNNGNGVPIVLNKMYGDCRVYIEGNKAYIYWKESGGDIYYATYDLDYLTTYTTQPSLPSGTIAYYDFDRNILDKVSGNNIVRPFSFKFYNDVTKGFAGDFTNNISSKAITKTNSTEFQQNNIGVELWFKSSSTGSGLRGIVVKQLAFGIFADAGVLKLYSWGAPTGFKDTGVNLNDNTWHKINVEFRNGVTNGTKVWVDDVLKLTTTYGFSAQTKKLVIGGGDDGSGSASNQEIKGYINKVRIYNIV
jgi:hypothetical protein